ncbi:MAG: hypothetical protein ACRD6X_01185 [Pyrinomonadaceae bacterium]
MSATAATGIFALSVLAMITAKVADRWPCALASGMLAFILLF